MDLDFTKILTNILINLDFRMNFRFKNGHRGWRNCISPSQLKLSKDAKKQATAFFNPELLYHLNLITEKQKGTLTRNNSIDTAGLMNCTLGTFVHELLLPEIEIYLRKLGINAIIELPVFSHKTGIFGTADLVIFDKGKMHIYDLKTTGGKILERHDPSTLYDDYKRQLYAYAITLNDMYEGEYVVDSAHIISVCKTPASMGYTPEGERVRLPISAQCEVDLDPVHAKYEKFMEKVLEEVMNIHHLIKLNDSNHDHWLLNGEVPEAFLKGMDEVNTRLEKLNVIP